MLAVPALDGVNVLVHVAVPAAVPAAKVHVVNVPVTPDTVNVTEPVGVLTGATEVSVTVAVHVDPWLTTFGLLLVRRVVICPLLPFTLLCGAVLLLPP